MVTVDRTRAAGGGGGGGSILFSRLIYGFVLLDLLTSTQAYSIPDKGGICEPREYYKEVDGDASAYIQCSPKVAQIGEWELLRCPKGEIFVQNSQKCKPASAVRRQQSLCQLQPYAPACTPMSCPASNVNPMLGGSCNWATASLIPFPVNPSYFLQCTPATTGAPCGVWTQMGCAAGSQFQPQLQVCVTVALPPGTCQNGYSPVCPCGPLNLCPGACVCFVGICCQPTVPFTPAPFTPPPYIPTTPPYIPPPPTTPPPLPICPNGLTAVSFCSPGCPIGFVCVNGGCCPVPTTPPPPPTCPNGAPGAPGTPCMGGGQSSCQQFFECINGACCPMPMPQCPNGQPTTQRCTGTGQSSCPANFYCANGGCCPLPSCPNGQSATQACAPGGTCPAGFQCQGGGCCPLPLCPNGVPAIQQCSGPGTCPSTAFCFNGGCCPIPNCPNGQMASQPCTTTSDCPTGFTCQGGGCCPLPPPTCPNGQLATTPCTGPGTCPAGFFCQTGPNGEQGCCPVPNCPSGQPALSPCGAMQSCPSGFTCQNNGCCPLPPTTPVPLPTCPNGQTAMQFCGPSNSCPPNFICVNNGCCPLPPTQALCPNGQMPLQPCGPGGSCPVNYMCLGGQCCYSPTMIPPTGPPLPPPTCPSCPPPTGGCQTCCPTMQVSLCMCAQLNNNCPTGASCNQGTCCAPQQSNYANQLKPGDRCTQPTECPGNPATGQCNNGYCVCIGNSRSNGFTCASYRRRYDPSESCNQFGTHCKLYGDRHERRKQPSLDELGIGNETVPLWWQSLSNNCVTDNECTPDMMCIDRKCYHHLRPGDYHCQFDEQCNRTCPGSVCVEVASVNMTMCKCDEGRFEFAHKCWRECPAGTRVKGQTCIPHKLEKSGVKTFAKRILSLFTPWSRDEPLDD